MKISVLSSIILLFVTLDLSSVNSLKVSDPKNSWSTNYGTIEEASLSVRPSGLYFEYGLYLTFSSRGTSLNKAKDTLEVVFNFELPKGAIVHDSWLWIGDDIVKAKILDKWSASSIYEGIVKRRKDPSILSKISSTQYELRVFPMVGNETRKVKITYLMPNTWNNSLVAADLPIALINTSANKNRYFNVFAFTDSVWFNPQIVNDDLITFSNETDSVFGNFKRAIIDASKYTGNLKIGYHNPSKKGLYFSKFQKENEGVYQLALLPSVFLDSIKSTKAAILIDYDITNTTISTASLLNELKTEMLNYMTDKDSFNLIYSNLTITRYSENWISASKENIEKAFNSLTKPLSTYSNLLPLLSNGVDFIKKNGNDGKIVLLSNSDAYGEYQTANKIINDLMDIMNPKIPIHVSDYQSVSFPYYYINSRYYYGNDYLYSNLSRLTLGSYHRVRDGLVLSEVINSSFKFLRGAITSFDFYTSMSSGLCHSRYNMNGYNSITYFSEPIVQVGKFKGDFPFKIQISGEYNNKLFSKEIEINENEAYVNDSTSRLIWTGQYIKELESGQQSNDIINELIFSSLNNRILSLYTSFLCLEDTNMICHECQDESRMVNIDNVKLGGDSLIIYPNPIKDKLTIELYCNNPDEVKKFAIYNITGNLVYQFNLSQLTKGRNILTWYCEKQKSGIYLLVYNNGKSSKTIKLTK